jgi:uncharacterized membrane protein
MKKPSILFVGESAIVQTFEYKGQDAFSTIRYGNNGPKIVGKMLSRIDHDLTYIPCHMIPFEFPRSIEALAEYDVVLFSDVGSNTFLLLPEMVRDGVRVPNLLELVCEFVRGGGGFGMIGGYMSFGGMDGKAKWKDSCVEEILPVSLAWHDDRKEVPEGADLSCVPGSHPILEGLPADLPYILGYNKVAAKADSKVLVSFRGDPIIAVAQRGKGRTLAYTTDCAPHWAPAAMHDWDKYPVLWANIVNWLSGATT